MQVKEIIQHTEWLPNPQPGAETPTFSILMPTYRRFASGYLTRAIQSVLDQTYGQFELLIIDDGSVDGSFGEIQRFMQLDPRVHCLHHPRNVGLPALACYEAFLKARGEYIMFCFDDTEYRPAALEKVAHYITTHHPKVAFGYIDYQYKDSHDKLQRAYLGREKISQAHLQITNFLPNLGAILHRQVASEIGFLDPHPAVARMTDWDYWRRAAKAYELRYTDIHIGTELGLVTGDSLGLTYPLNPWMAYEWTERERNEALVPGKYEDYDVQCIPEDLSDQSQLALFDLLRFYNDKFWRRPQPPLTILPTRSGKGLNPNAKILVLTRIQDASVTLTFEHLRAGRQIIRFVSPIRFDPQEMVSASALIISLHLFSPEMYQWVQIARELGVPLYYYLDDNYVLLSKELAELKEYSEAKMRNELRSFHGVLVTSPQLADFFMEHKLHTKVHVFPPIISAEPWLDYPSLPPKAPGAFRLGFMGGRHRSGDFNTSVLPAIAQLAQEHVVELVVAGDHNLPEQDYPQLKLYRFPFDVSYGLALGRMQGADIDVLMHAGSPTSNNPYKTHNVLLNAASLKALPVLAAQPPYEEVELLGLGLLCRDTTDWYRNLKRAVSEPGLAAQILENLYEYVAKHYSGKQNLEVIRLISEECPAPGTAVIDNRYRLYIDALRKIQPQALPLNFLQFNGTVRLIRRLEYRLRPRSAGWNGLSFMIGTHGQLASGRLEVEIVDVATRSLVRQAFLDLSKILDNQTVQVDFAAIPDSTNREYTIQFLLRSADPQTTVSIYEVNPTEPKFQRMLRRLGIFTQGNILACRLYFEE